jgi:hypothetical protein
MANNIHVGVNAVIALKGKTGVPMDSLGFNPSNTVIVYEAAQVWKSWVPGRSINAFDTLVEERGYVIISKQDMDLTASFAAPLPTGGGGGGNGPLVFAGDNQELPANSSTASLQGSATPPQGQTVSGYLWLAEEWPTGAPVPIFQSKNNRITQAQNLRPGSYVFQLQAMSSGGGWGMDKILITVAQPDAIFVNAGTPQALDEYVDTANLYGSIQLSGSAELDYLEWSVTTPGVTGVTFSNPNDLQTGVDGIPTATLETGNLTTTFRLTAYDILGNAWYAETTVMSRKPANMYIISGWDPARPTQKGYVYETQGYDPVDPVGYGIIFYFGGIGSNGDQNPPAQDGSDDVTAMLLEETGLPKLLWDKIYPLRVCMIACQNHSGVWTPEQTQKVVTWAFNNLNINPKYVYDTGYSSGGYGSINAAYNNPNTTAAVIAIHSVQTDLNTPGNADVVKNVPILMVHSYNDNSTLPAATTFPAMEALLSTSPQGFYPPLIIMNWYYEHNFQGWNNTVYDKRVAQKIWGKLYFDEWLLLHSTDRQETCTNYVSMAERTKDWEDWARAKVLVDQLPSGTGKNQLLQRLNVLNTGQDANSRYYFLNLGGNANSPGYAINNVPSAANGSLVTGLMDTDGNSSSYGFQVVQNVQPGTRSNTLNHKYIGTSAEIYGTSFYVDPATPSQWKFIALNPNRWYDLYLFVTDKSTAMLPTGNRSGIWSFANNDQAQSWLAGWNTDKLTKHINVKPTAGGEIILNLEPEYGYFGQVAAIMLRERTSGIANPRSNFAKYNFALTATGVDANEWATMIGNPTTGVRTIADPVSGWVMSTVAVDRWANYAGQYASDTEAADGVYPPEFPTAVARSAYWNLAINFDLVYLNNFNLECIGRPGMGLPAGRYRVKVFCTTSADWNPTRVACQIGNTGVQIQDVVSKNNFTKYASFVGDVPEGGTIKLTNMSVQFWGVTLINAVIIEKVD